MKTKNGFILRSVGDNYIIVPVGAEAQKFNGLIKLNSVGKEIWEKLEAGAEREDLIAFLIAEYGVEREIAEADIDRFVSSAEKANLIEI